MKILIVITLLTFSSVSFATPYDAFIGCYKLVSLDGESVSSSRDSSIAVGSPKWYYNLDNSSITGLVATILADESGGAAIHEADAFDNVPGGKITIISPQKFQFHFSGKIKSKWDWQVHSLEYTTSFEKDPGGQVSISSDVSEDNKQHYKHSFGLSPIVCR